MTVKIEVILDRAGEVLAKSPAASLSDIAAAAGISRTTLFNRFATREALVEALALRALDQVEQAVTAIDLDRTEDPHAVIHDLATALVALGPRMAYLLREPALDASPRVDERITAVDLPLLTWIERCQTDGHLRPDLPSLWLLTSLYFLIYGAWDDVHGGRLAARDAPRCVAALYLGGAAAPDAPRTSRGTPTPRGRSGR